MDHTQLGLVTLGATQGIAIFTTLMPSRTTLYNANVTPGTCQNVRQGELVATVLTLGFAAILTYLTKDRTPLMIAGATVITMIAAYEYTLRAQPMGETSELA